MIYTGHVKEPGAHSKRPISPKLAESDVNKTNKQTMSKHKPLMFKRASLKGCLPEHRDKFPDATRTFGPLRLGHHLACSHRGL